MANKATISAMIKRRFILLCLLFVAAILSGCNARSTAIPTLMDIDASSTQAVLTQNAPPAGFDTVDFTDIDANLTRLTGWRYDASLVFRGTYASTTREANASTRASVWYNQVASARRVVAHVSGDLQENEQDTRYEAVRLGPDAFLVRDGTCLTNAGEDAAVAADLTAGELLGGIRTARVAPQKATINGESVWRYQFSQEDLILPAISLTEDGSINSVSGELWVAPEYHAVVRFYANINVENAFILGSTLPLTGTISLQYDLYDVGEVPNISVPFGC
ncbi:hypothetical protein G4Y79_00410 [Phototrophicus methaneseepsis]|uniref:Lipoprotein n=1 Tax=Phototrophicus methaneseepsis TaxID=2710758 RepID=A0A7S8E9I6_9CHLR|nr:hypothetical protein [Phototrophicus methaneseepsis]QPC82866.1 hypothetical protein G4Y79_00410 [Phototrophicus methaneseepsis]